MNTLNFQEQDLYGMLGLTLVVEDDMTIDEIAYRVIAHDRPSFLIPYKEQGINGKKHLTYQIDQKVSIAYYTGTLTIKELLTIYNNLLKIFTGCGNWFLNKENFCQDTRYIYIDKNTYDVSMLYVPIKQYVQGTNETKALLLHLLDKCEDDTASEVMMKLYRYFSQSNFSILRFKEVLRELNGAIAVDKVQEPIVQPEIVQAVPPRVESVARPTEYPSGESDEDSLKNNLLEQMRHKEEKKDKTKNKGFFSNLFSSKKEGKEVNHAMKHQVASEQQGQEVYVGAQTYEAMPEPVEAAYTPQNAIDDDVTCIFEEAHVAGAYLSLVAPNHRFPMLQTNITINKVNDVFTIGRYDSKKGIVQSDYEFDATVKAVSRMHARIQFQEGNYYMIDLGAANGTYINGQKLLANKMYPLTPNDRIAFSTQGIEYVFCTQ